MGGRFRLGWSWSVHLGDWRIHSLRRERRKGRQPCYQVIELRGDSRVLERERRVWLPRLPWGIGWLRNN